jgi:DNA-binding CsgD family transcriptional regulator
MAPHLALWMLVAGLVAGVVAATLIRTMYREYGFVYLRAYFRATVTFVAILLVSIASLYFEQNLRDGATAATALAVDVAYNVLSPILHLIMLYLLVIAVCGLVSRRTGKGVAYTVVASIAVFFGWQAYQTIAAISRSGTRIPSLPADLVFLTVTLASVAAFVCLYRWADREPNPQRKKCLKTLAALVLILMGLAAAFGAISFANLITESAILIVGCLFLVAFSLVPVVYLRWFMRALYGVDSGVNAKRVSVGDFCAKYGLTNRETEIAKLVGEGRSNRDIGDLLFISHQTVKDHIHHIFRKTGVKNRVQLANLLAQPTNESNEPL